MSLQHIVQSPRGQLILGLIRSLNVAAICALGIWHGYLFRVEHAVPAAVEFPAYTQPK
jgi:hypothetical protein